MPALADHTSVSRSENQIMTSISNNQEETVVTNKIYKQLPRVLVLDSMAIVQSFKKTPAMIIIKHLKGAFVKRIVCMMNNYI